MVMERENGTLKPSIGFIGMGHMGSHMAQRLLDEDFSTMIKFMEELAGLSTRLQ
jgi:hypothetical protein